MSCILNTLNLYAHLNFTINLWDTIFIPLCKRGTWDVECKHSAWAGAAAGAAAGTWPGPWQVCFIPLHHTALLCSDPWVPVMIALSLLCYITCPTNSSPSRQVGLSGFPPAIHNGPGWCPGYRALECRPSGSLVLIHFRCHSAMRKWCLMRSISYLSSWVPELSLEAPWFYHTHPAPHWSHLCASATFSFSGNSCTEAAGGRVAGVSYRQEKICRLVPVGTYLTFLYVSYFLCRLRVIILMLWGGCVPQLAHGCKAQHNMGHAVNDMEKRASTSAWGWACDVG